MAADLEAVDRQRKELIANVSHELRTPISALRAVLENVVDGVTEPDPPTMRLALEQAERLGRLVSTLLDLSRIDAGAVELDREDVALEEFLGTVAREATVSMLTRDGAAGAPTPWSTWSRRRSPCAPTASACTRSRPTCWTTRSATPRPAAR